MASTNKADELAGSGSFSDRLRRRRLAVEAGDLEAAQRIAAGTETPEDAQYGGGKSGSDNSGQDTTEKPSGGAMRLLKDLLISKKGKK